MSRAGGQILNNYFSDYIKGKTRRAYSSYYVVQFPHCSVLMSKKVENDEEKEIVRYRGPNGSAVVFFVGDNAWNKDTRTAAGPKVYRSSLLSTHFVDEYLDLKLLDYKETVSRDSCGCVEKYVTSVLFEDSGSNFVLQVLPVSDKISQFEVESVDETKQYVKLFNYRIPKGINTLAQAEKYYFEKEYGVDVLSCYRILGSLIVPLSKGCEPEEKTIDEDTLTRILNPYTGLDPKYADTIRKFNAYLGMDSFFKPFSDKAQVTDHPFRKDYFRYLENVKLAGQYRVNRSKPLDYLFASAILKDGLPMIDCMRDDSENEYVKGTFVSDKETTVILNKWHRLINNGGQ